MWFNSFLYMGFFMVVLGLFYAMPTWRARKIVLLVASYAFYASWNPPFVFLLFGSTVVDFWAGRALARRESTTARRLILLTSCIANLGSLAFFKYSGFFLESFLSVASLLGVRIQYTTTPGFVATILLPAGISFYVFQSLSYTIDVYRRQLPPCESLVDFFLFVSFFPQLVAGPIVRAATLLPQLSRKPLTRWSDWEDGGALIVLGLFQKMVMADNLAPMAELVFSHPGQFSTIATWFGVYAFAFQIYFDFAGYSNIALGSARLLGIRLPENFRSPYISTSLREFWTRWHISLSRWIRDYLYVPLGGSRRSRPRTVVNLVITMGLAGLWHGAAWTFVIWGLLHGAFLTVEHLVFGRARDTEPGFGHSVVRALLTFHLVCLGWVFFRAESFLAAIWILEPMLSLTGGGLPSTGFDRISYVVVAFVFTAVVFVAERVGFERVPRWSYAAGCAVLMFLTIVGYGDATEFIYFRF